MQVLLKLNDDELKLMTEEEFEKMKDELDEFDGIHPYIIMGWLHDKKPICNMCNDYLDYDSRPVDQQVSQNFCEWEWNTTFEKHGIVSACGHRLTELYRDHNYIYCPYCGKEIKTVKELSKNFD